VPNVELTELAICDYCHKVQNECSWGGSAIMAGGLRGLAVSFAVLIIAGASLGQASAPTMLHEHVSLASSSVQLDKYDGYDVVRLSGLDVEMPVGKPIVPVRYLRLALPIGYRAVELSSVGPLPPRELARVLDGEGLTCCSTHEDVEELLTDPEGVIERLEVLGCKATVYPWPRGQDFTSAEGVKRLSKALNRCGKVFARAGITFAYHNHNLEFHRLNGRTVFEMLLAETDPKAVAAVRPAPLETSRYWVAAEYLRYARAATGGVPHYRRCDGTGEPD
jgi:hypothetical protein